ncbi:MAG: hypothetical protein ACR2N7_04460 [Acidimicrobiia bacterium]
MKAVLDSTSEIGQRTGHILLGDSTTDFVGLWNAPEASSRARSGPVDDVAGFDVVVSDRMSNFEELLARCSVAGVPLVLWTDGSDLHSGPAAAPVVKGANMSLGLSEALSHYPSAERSAADSVVVGWTEVGKPHGSGTAIPFPDPVGMSWGTERSTNRFVALREDEWAGVSVTVEGKAGKRIVGVADLSNHLEALTLAAAALAASEGAYEDRIQMASAAGEQLLNKLLHLELDVAVWRSTS